jgi:hypothetical protein
MTTSPIFPATVYPVRLADLRKGMTVRIGARYWRIDSDAVCAAGRATFRNTEVTVTGAPIGAPYAETRQADAAAYVIAATFGQYVTAVLRKLGLQSTAEVTESGPHYAIITLIGSGGRWDGQPPARHDAAGDPRLCETWRALWRAGVYVLHTETDLIAATKVAGPAAADRVLAAEYGEATPELTTAFVDGVISEDSAAALVTGLAKIPL